MAYLEELEQGARDFLAGQIFCGAVGMANLFLPLSDEPLRERPVTAFHVLFTAPFHRFYGDTPFSMTEHEQWTARLSALAWRRYNGAIHLFTDPEGAAYVRQIGLEGVYDSVREDLWDPYGLDQKKFWASGKLLALERMPEGCLLLDMDLIVWRPLPLDGASLAAAHTEHLCDAFYPGTDYFLMSPRYRFPADWDYTAEPLNTSILYLKDRALKEEYLAEAIAFMRAERDTPDNGSNCMIFAEQRILAMCAARRGVRARTFLNYDAPLERQTLITHTWSGKLVLSRRRAVEEVFVAQCRKRCRELERQRYL